MSKRDEATESVETTRQRIVEAACHVFADRGFAHATVREIVDRAGANIAAVNYHFGGKNDLYTTVLRKLMDERSAAHPYDAGLPSDATPKQRLHIYIRAFLRRMIIDENGSPLGRLMIREMIEPTHALDGLVRDVMAPATAYLLRIAEAIAGREFDQRERFHVISSVIGQVVFHKHCRAVIDRMFPGQPCTSEEVDRLAEHITDFTYVGIEQMGRKQGDRK